VQHCYRKHLETKFAASPYNLKGRIKDLTADNDGLRKELSELTARIDGIESQFKGPPAAQVARVTNRPIGSNSETDNSTSAATHQSKPQNVPKREKLPGQRHEFQAEIPNPWPELKYKARAAVYWTNGMRWGMTDRAELIFGNENLLKLLEMRKKLGPVDGSIAFFTDRKMSMNEVEAEMRDLVDGRRQPRHIWTEAVEVVRSMPQKAIVSVPAEAKKQATKVQTEEIDTFTAAIASFESEVARKRRPVEIEM
jgi:hypothetical protein